MIRIEIGEQCEGHGNCYSRFPELFEPDDQSKSVPTAAVVPDDQRRKVRRAVGGCPAEAISMQEFDDAQPSGTKGGQ